MTRALLTSGLIAGTLGMSSVLACGDKGDDTGETRETGEATSAEICDDGIDNDGDGQRDCDDPDCGGDPVCPETNCDDAVDNDGDGHTDCDDSDCDCGHSEVAYIVFRFEIGVRDGVQVDLTSSGAALEPQFSVILASERWDGTTHDPNEFCMVSYPVADAEVDPSCTACWTGMSWSVDSSDPTTARLTGDCDGLSSLGWGDDVREGLAAIPMSFGFSNWDNADAAFKEDLEAAYGAVWTDPEYQLGSHILAGWIAWEGTWHTVNLALTYAIDDAGDIGAGDSWQALANDAASPPNGWYTALSYYGFRVE